MGQFFFLHFHWLLHKFISPLIEIEVSLRNGRRSIEARKYSEQILLLTRHI